MAHKVVFAQEHHDDTALVEADPSLRGYCKGATDYAFAWPLSCQDQYVLGSMSGDMLEWLNTNPALRGHNQLGFNQSRTGDLAFTRRLFVDFDEPQDAMLFKLTWQMGRERTPA